MNLLTIYPKDSNYEVTPLASATGNFSSSTSATLHSSLRYFSISFYKIVTILVITFSILFVVIVVLISRKFKNLCTFSLCQRTADESYTSVPSDESLERVNRGYGIVSDRDTQHRDELSSILDIPSVVNDVQSRWNGSEYDNLSLNPTLSDSDIMDAPPDYEHPPPYEPPPKLG